VNRRRLLKIALPLTVAMVVAGVAFAFFTSTGSGSGTGSTQSSAQAVTIASGTPSSPLFPGGSGSVAVDITNPNNFRVKINSLVLDTSQGTNGFDVDSGHSTCDTSVLHFTTQDNSAAGWFVPAKVGSTNGDLPLDLAGALSMDSSAANACQGASFTVHLKPGS
jgi:hypothetical protein